MEGMLLGRAVRFGYINARCRALKSKLLDKDLFHNALMAEGLGDIYSLLNTTPYAPYIKSARKETILKGLEESFKELYKKSTSTLTKEEKRIFDLFFIEREAMESKRAAFKSGDESYLEYKRVELEYLKRVKTTLEKMDRSLKRDLAAIVGSYFDSLNLYTIVRLRVLYKKEPEEVVPFLVPYGIAFGMKELSKVAGMSGIGEISDALHGKIGTSFGGYREFMRAVREFHMRAINRVWYGYPFKISVIFSLLRMKELEIKDIRALVEGVYYRLPEDEIAKMIGGV